MASLAAGKSRKNTKTLEILRGLHGFSTGRLSV
jgi:hypothetical protein